MKDKNSVGIYGKLHGLLPKLERDLPAAGFTAIQLDPQAFAHSRGMAAVICALSDPHPESNQVGVKELSTLSRLIASAMDDRLQLIYVSVARTNHPEVNTEDFAHLNLEAEKEVRSSGLPYTIVRATSTDDRPGGHHKVYWKQDVQGQQKGSEHPLPWEDLSQVLVQCVNRPAALAKTFTVHAISGEPVDDWDQWFEGLNPDSAFHSPTKKIAS